MPKLAIIATMEVAPGKRKELLAALLAHRARCLKDEQGITLRLDVLLPREDDSRVLLHEVYRDDAAFEVHRNGPSIAQFRRDTAEMGVKLVVTRCEPVE
jgi:quinol monooxygenase YgiN